MIKSDTSLRTESMRPRGGGYSSTREKYTGSGKQNKKAGFGVIGGFVSGWILFFVSICFICWNERKSVKDTEALDYLEVTCHDGTKGTLSTDPKNKNFALFCGTGQVVKPAEITNLGLFSNKTAYISTSIVKYAGTELVIEKNDDGEETGRKEKEMWIDHNEDLERILSPEYKGELLVVENNIKFDTNLIADKSKPYRFEYDKTAVFEAFLKSNNWRYNSDNYYCAIDNETMFVLRKEENVSADDLLRDIKSKNKKFEIDDLQISMRFVEFAENQPITILGQIDQDNENKSSSKLNTFHTGIREAGFCCICGCGDAVTDYTYERVWLEHKTKKDVIKEFEESNSCQRWGLRLCGFLLHYFSIYLILYPLIFLIGMIPFIGKIGATILILFALIFSLITFLFLVACAWIIARPLLGILLFALIFALMYAGKTTRDKYSPNYDPNNPYGYNQNNGNYYNGYNNHNQGNGYNNQNQHGYQNYPQQAYQGYPQQGYQGYPQQGYQGRAKFL